MRTIGAFFTSLATRPDTEQVSIGWAVPHRSHRPGLVREGNRCRERAFVVDAGSFIYVSCHCGATPHEIADDLEIGRDILHPYAAEQSLMLTLQRRLREDFGDPATLELLRLKGITVAQAMLWKMSHAGLPPAEWAQDSEASRAA